MPVLAAQLLVVFVCSSNAEPVNLLTNGGFERGPADWRPDPKHELVTDARQAHGGQACLAGEVTGDRQALILRRTVPVRVGYRYDFAIWARATNKTKLAVRVVHPGVHSPQPDAHVLSSVCPESQKKTPPPEDTRGGA